MELKVKAVSIPEAITFNYEELKAELLQNVSVYETMIYGEDQIKEAKTDRANLNRLKKVLNDERIRREKEYMEPFNQFKAQISEIISIIDKASGTVDKQVKAAEEQRKQDKLCDIENFWNSCIVPEGIELRQILDLKWLNASVSMKSIQDSIDSRIAEIEKDLSVVRSMPSYAFEAEQAYKQTLDLAKAVSEAHRLQEQAEKKAAWEAEQAARKPVLTNLNDPNDIENLVGIHPVEPSRQWIGFQAFLSVDEAKSLGTWMKAMGIKYKAI